MVLYNKRLYLLQSRIKNLLVTLANFVIGCLCIHIYSPQDSPQDDKNYRESCSKKIENIAFAKTHKCASSTIQNILMRKAAKEEWGVVFPPQGNFIGDGLAFNKKFIQNSSWEDAGLVYKLFCLHTVWNHQEISGVMPSDTFYFTVLRDPVELFISMWDYYYYFEEEFRVTLEEFIFRLHEEEFADRRKITVLGRNQMLFDLGMKPEDFDNEEKVKQKIREVEQQFDLVLISESFEESIILLKNQLCWGYEDLNYVKLNQRDVKKKSVISPEARNRLRSWLAADYMLYNHFAAKFEQLVQSYGPERMNKDKQRLRESIKAERARCSMSEVDNKLLKGKQKLWGEHMIGIQVNHSDLYCRLYGLSENAFIDVMKKGQTRRACDILSKKGRPCIKPTERPSFNIGNVKISF